MTDQTIFNDYLAQEYNILRDLKRQEQVITLLVDEIVSTSIQGRKAILFGNGGSASTASHIVCDLAKGATIPGKTKVKAICLTDNIPMVTAWANDADYESIFAQQLEVYYEPGDLVIAISGSGNSPNVLKGVNVAKDKGAVCFGLCGFHGGKLAKLANHAIIISGENIQQAEDFHLIVLHLVFLMVAERLRAH